MTAALLSCSDARIDAGGAVLLDALSFEAEGARVGLVGDFSPLFRLFSRNAVLARGSVHVLGCPAESAVATTRLGLAPGEPLLPEPWKVLDYLAASAGLMGLHRRAALRTARDALELLESGPLAKQKIGTLGTVERRIMLIAHAVLGHPPAVFLDRPLARLSDEGSAEVRAALERAAHGRRLIVSVESPAGVGAELNLLTTMDRIVVMRASTVVAVGPPEETLKPSPRCVVVAARHTPALANALVERGLRVERPDDPESDAGRLVVHLPEGKTAMVIAEAALEVEAPLLELVSVGLDPPG